MIECTQSYVIKPGDSLFSISAMFNVTPEKILRLNPGLDANNLPVGEEICVISGTFQPVTCPLGTIAYNINRGDTLASIAQKFSVEVSDILNENPSLNPNNLTPGQRICIPSPFSPVEILINVSNKRLIVFRDGRIYREYIIATGAPESPTPTGNFEIINKELDPGGPYGTRWLGLSALGYGIHGTNNPASIGTASSNGCIRMYNEDVESLFNLVNVGTPVRIIP